MFLHSAQVAGKILTTRTVGGLSPVPFACMFTNGLLWLYYGALKNDPVIYGPNATGAIIGVGCIIAYESKSTVGNLLTYGAFLCVCVVATVLAFWNDVDNLGYVGCGLSVVNTAAPLATLPTVIRERSTAALPLNPILMNFFGSLSWALYGILVVKDPMVRVFTCSCVGASCMALLLNCF